jgi:cytochrome c peroxidase
VLTPLWCSVEDAVKHCHCRLYLQPTRQATPLIPGLNFAFQGTTVAHDGQRMRVFTVPSLRNVGKAGQQNLDSFLSK